MIIRSLRSRSQERLSHDINHIFLSNVRWWRIGQDAGGFAIQVCTYLGFSCLRKFIHFDQASIAVDNVSHMLLKHLECDIGGIVINVHTLGNQLQAAKDLSMKRDEY